jgi:hypothetical protein
MELPPAFGEGHSPAHPRTVPHLRGMALVLNAFATVLILGISGAHLDLVEAFLRNVVTPEGIGEEDFGCDFFCDMDTEKQALVRNTCA